MGRLLAALCLTCTKCTLPCSAVYGAAVAKHVLPLEISREAAEGAGPEAASFAVEVGGAGRPPPPVFLCAAELAVAVAGAGALRPPSFRTPLGTLCN